MEFLKWLEALRTPALDGFFGLITRLGEETFLMVIAMVVLWCVDKKKGMYLIGVGFSGILVNQFIKITARVPRPWVLDPSFSPVESAIEGAGGYSFPSGHTQTAAGMFGGIARGWKNVWLRAVCIALAILVGFSRMYLGVHTPADVLWAAAMSCVLFFGIYPLIDCNYEKEKVMHILFAAFSAVAFAYLLYVELFPFPEDVDSANMLHAVENAYKLLGAVMGIWFGYFMERNVTRYDTKAIWWGQIIKVAVGLGLFMAIQSNLKVILPDSPVFGGIRYFIMIGVMAGLWPVVFRFFPKGKHHKEEV